jgi:nicotinamide mononucleotide (NMN) deamidase PncC
MPRAALHAALELFHHWGQLLWFGDALREWVVLDPQWLAEVSPESLACSQALAQAALRRTPEADLALDITGDLDPTAPVSKQGRVFLALAQRPMSIRQPRSVASSSMAETPATDFLVEGRELQLQTADRSQRQGEAAQRLLEFALDWLKSHPSAIIHPGETY